MARELDKVITVGDEDYKVNAVTADKVNKKLKINKIDLNGNVAADPVEFDGEEERAIDVVPASGGHFTGPIRVGNNTEASINNEAILNYYDITETVFGEFKNHSALYTWDNSQINEENKFKIVIEGETPNSISLVQGLETHLPSFADKNYYNGYLSVYLYVCTDTGNIYYGAANKDAQFNYEPIRLARLAEEADWAETADWAEKLTSTEETSKYDTAAKLTTAFNAIDSKLETIDGENGKIAELRQIIEIIKGIGTEVGSTLDDDTVLKALYALNLIGIDADGSELSYDAKTIKELLTWKSDIISGNTSVKKAQNILDSSNNSKTYQDILDAIVDEVTKVTESDGGYTAYKAGRLTTTDGTITAAELLETAQGYVNTLKTNLTKSKDPITVAKASRDEDGWMINHSYYRCTFNTKETNTITISTSAPSGGVKGDIWIKYVK